MPASVPPDGGLNPPHGGTLVNLLVDDARAAEMKATAGDHASLTLDERGLCDLELLAVGGFSPLTGFLGQADHDRVLGEMRLADGTLWPLPITLPVTPGDGVAEGQTLALRDVYGNLLAFLHVEEIYPINRAVEAAGLYGLVDPRPPATAPQDRQHTHHAAGRLEVLRVPPHYDFVDLRRTPAELRAHVQALGWSKVVAFHTRALMHRADEEVARDAAARVGGGLLIQPAVGVPRPGDVEHYTRVRCYRALVDAHFEPGSAVLSLLPLTPRRPGPREVLLRAIVGRNFGCSHLIVGPDPAGPEETLSDDPHAGRAIRETYAPEVGMELVDARPRAAAPEAGAPLSDDQVRDAYLARGLPLPDSFTRPAVAAILAEAHPPRFRQGLTIWFTGLSGSGKSTVAHALVERLAEYGRFVSMLDGDEIRTHLSKGLSFSKDDRDTNIRRVGYVAGLVAQHGGTTLCSVISPYRAVRDEVRRMSNGHFVEVYCATPIEVCERRDVKGLYARARAAAAEGKPMGFTGIDDPYEPPLDPEVTLDTGTLSVEQCVDAMIHKLLELGYIRPQGHQLA